MKNQEILENQNDVSPSKAIEEQLAELIHEIADDSSTETDRYNKHIHIPCGSE